MPRMHTTGRGWIAGLTTDLRAYTLGWVAGVLAVLIASASARAGVRALDPAAAHERWYVVLLEGQRAGHLVTTEERVGEGDAAQVRTRTYMKVEIKRGAIAVPISTESVWLETPDGAPLSLTSTTRLGAMPTERTYEFGTPGAGGGERVRVRTRMGSQTTREEIDAPQGPWMTPAAARRHVEAKLAAGEQRIVVRSIEDDPSGGGLMAVEMTKTVQERTTAEVFGRVVPAIKWKVTIDRYPGIEVAEFVDERGESVRSETDLGGIRMVQVLADKDLALSPVDAPELLASTLVTPDKPIDRPRRVATGEFVLTVPGGKIDEPPQTPSQRVERLGPGSVRVSVTTRTGEGPPGSPPGDDPSFMASSLMIRHDDPAVRALLGESKAADITDPARRAEHLRRFVHRIIRSKELSVGFASASEVARTRAGDCSEHGVLLAALLRAAGTPSRVVSGLLYVDEFAGREGIFGYHMWTQAWLPIPAADGAHGAAGAAGAGRWVDLDATLPPETPFDATHIALGVSALSEGSGENFMVSLASLLKRLQIRVEKAEP